MQMNWRIAGICALLLGASLYTPYKSMAQMGAAAPEAATPLVQARDYAANKDYDKAIDLMTTIHNDPNNLYHQKFTAGFIRKVKMLRWR